MAVPMDINKERNRKMLEKFRKKSRRIIAFGLSLLTMLSMVSSSATIAFAADGAVRIDVVKYDLSFRPEK